ncbi:hypothetical protein DPMN_083373 [Dreissena polymorpha]|uniref:Uncharacterized protein n=1 Tax=Dreissena polymorpha TaxID=45954 RepID=A0A9D3Y979_DREPO|nr:hypothetical protein DPMN_083373 [Dreissena polymorpha]
MDTAIKRLVVQCPSWTGRDGLSNQKTCSPVPFPGQARMDTAIKRLVVQCPSQDRQRWIQQSKDL